jgi:hypothetical protein
VFEYGVLRRIFGPKWDEVTGGCTKLQNEELIICTVHEILLERSNRKVRIILK